MIRVVQEFFCLLSGGTFGWFRQARQLIYVTKLRPRVVRESARCVRSLPSGIRKSFSAEYKLKDHGVSAGKYFNFPLHVCRAVAQADALGLIRAKSRKRVLDLGTGFGYFPLACEALGHVALAIDKGGKPIYTKARQALGFEVTEWSITPETPLPNFSIKFDLVSAFQPVFFLYSGDGRYGESQWSHEEWRCFFKGVSSVLDKGGRFFLGGNGMSESARREFRKIEGSFARAGAKVVLDGWIFDRLSLEKF